MINVLFTSVGRRVELLQAFRKAYHSLGLSGRIVATDVDPLAPALQVADGTYIVPPFRDANFIPSLAEICRREHINIVFPLIDPDIPLLSTHREALEKAGARVAVVSPEACAIAGDKWQTAKFFEQLGLPVPRSWIPEDMMPRPSDYPVFIKPRGGSAGKDSFKAETASDLAFLLKRVENPIVQEYLPGPEITNDIVCTLDGELLGIVSRQRIEVRWGEVAKGVTIHDDRILEACSSIARHLPAIGPITVQCIMKDGIPHFTEINARFGGGAPLGIAAGVDSPRWLLAKAAGIPIEIPPIGSYKVGLYLTRCDHSYFIESSDLADIAGHTLRPG